DALFRRQVLRGLAVEAALRRSGRGCPVIGHCHRPRPLMTVPSCPRTYVRTPTISTRAGNGKAPPRPAPRANEQAELRALRRPPQTRRWTELWTAPGNESQPSRTPVDNLGTGRAIAKETPVQGLCTRCGKTRSACRAVTPRRRVATRSERRPVSP